MQTFPVTTNPMPECSYLCIHKITAAKKLNETNNKIPFCKYLSDAGLRPNQSPTKHTPLRAISNEFASIVVVCEHLPVNFRSSLMQINLRK